MLLLLALLAVNWKPVMMPWKTKDVKCEFLLEARMSNTSHYSVAEKPARRTIDPA